MTSFEEKDLELRIKINKWSEEQNKFYKEFGHTDPIIDEQIKQLKLERADNQYDMHKAISQPDPLWKRILNVFDPYA